MSIKSKIQILIPIAYLIIILVLFFNYLQTHQFASAQLIGSLLTSVSFLFWIISRIQLGDSFAIRAKAKSLVKSGLYSKFKHPVYLFSSTALLGITIFFQSSILLIVLVVFIVMQTFRAKKEEEILRKKFEKTYIAYAKKTWL